MQNKAIIAGNYMRQRLNCAQSVYCTFCKEIGLSFEKAASLSESNGGGRVNICGAVYSAHKILESLGKDNLINEYDKRFEKINMSILCKDLKQEKTIPNRKSCVAYAEEAASILEKLLEEGEK